MAPAASTGGGGGGGGAGGGGIGTLFQNMKFQKPGIPLMVSLACLTLAVLFQIIGLATPEWLVIEGGGSVSGSFSGSGSASFDGLGDFSVGGSGSYGSEGIGGGKLKMGLFQICVGDAGCSSISGESEEDWLNASRAFGVLGMLTLLAGLALAVLQCFMQHERLPLVSAAVALASGVLILIEFAIFAGEAPATDFGYSFALTVLAFLLAVGGGIGLGLPMFLKRLSSG